MKKYIILDIDRTIINHTSWYKACCKPDLLIARKQVSVFKKLNEIYFNKGNKDKFITETFSLLQNVVSKKFISYLKEINLEDDIQCGSFISEHSMFLAGCYTAEKLVKVEQDCYKCIKLLQNLYNNEIEIIYLTSGYQPFMEGLIQSIHKQVGCNVQYSISGTQLEISAKGIVSLGQQVITQKLKKEYVKRFMQSGDILLLADDSNEDPDLFNIVAESGGLALRIQFDKKNNKSNWHEIYDKYFSYHNLESYLKLYSPIKLLNQPLQSSGCWDFFKSRTNEIGILTLSKDEYEVIKQELITSNNEIILKDLEKYIFENNNSYYFRNLNYYYWLPTYLNPELSSIYDRWYRFYNTNVISISDLIALKPDNISKSTYSFILYVFCDNFLNSLYLASYYFSLKNLKIEILDKTIISINSLVLKLLNDEINYFDLEVLQKYIYELKNVNFSSVNQITKSLIEFDNLILNLSYAKEIVSQIEIQKESIGCIVCFTLGAIELGYAFKTMLDEKLQQEIPLILLNYSSKRKMRDEKSKSISDSLFSETDLELFESLKKTNKKILLCDNNATTFKTLVEVGNFFYAKGINVLPVVESVNYKNIVNFIYKTRPYEDMDSEYINVLNYSPLENYITSFDTWGTSRKSEILEEIFLQPVIEPIVLDKIFKPNSIYKSMKLCRVHNVFDLNVAISLGMTMIGIHVVNNDKKKYYKQSIITNKKIRKFKNNPVPDIEIESIRRLASIIPDYILPIFVFERKISIKKIKSSLKILNFNNLSEIGIQLQFRVSESYIKKLYKLGFKSVCCTIGLFQNDFEYYYNLYNKCLRPEQDFILIDFSKHQPDIINNKSIEDLIPYINKEELLRNIFKKIQKNKIPILIADDVPLSKQKKYVEIGLSLGMKINGIDMQNIIEANKNEQQYVEVMTQNKKKYLAKLIKAPLKIHEWKMK